MAKRNELFYGHSGTGKSEAELRMMQIVWEQKRLKSRVWIGDGSAATYIESGMVDEGIIEICSWEGRDWPITTLNLAAQGYWPADTQDPDSPLLATSAEDMAKIGVWAFEGASTAGGYIMGDQKGGLANRSGAGQKLGQDAPYSIVDADLDRAGNVIKGTGPGHVYGGNPLAHFGIGQKRLLGIVETSKSLPGEFLFWTAHERSAEDKVSKENIIGPEVIGGALTASFQRYFGNTLHFATAEKRAKKADAHTGKNVDEIDVEFRIYTRDHISPTTLMKYKAVTRGGLTAQQMPQYLTSDVPGDAIEEFYRRLGVARSERQKRYTLPTLSPEPAHVSEIGSAGTAAVAA